ncbi:MAG TPA: O-methyltransferase [Gemmatimonadaceae bacterium]|nr:O-methyltransferase [Gemmatimonadaceae bacterium]
MEDRLEEYVGALYAHDDALLNELREEADRAGLPPIAITPRAGRTLQVLLRAVGARRVLEIGTLGGYSAIWMARALGDEGRILSLEVERAHAEFARRQLARAGLADRVTIRVGRALELLPALDGEQFDAVFIDADKEPMPTYLDWALRLTRKGGLIAADNALWGGRVADPEVNDAATLAVREFNRRFASEPRLDAVVLPVGDGLAIAVVG